MMITTVECFKCGEILTASNEFVQCKCKETFINYIRENIYQTSANEKFINFDTTHKNAHRKSAELLIKE